VLASDALARALPPWTLGAGGPMLGAPREAAVGGGSLPQRLPRVPVPNDQSGGALRGATGPGGLGVLLFSALLLSFLLVTPNAGRWLRSVLALGLSPAYVASGERPG
jgi:hypothetical protein